MCAHLALTISHVLGVEPVQEGIRFSPLTADHHILPGLVPEVIAKGSGVVLPLPRSLHFKALPIQQNEPPCKGNGHRCNIVLQKSLNYSYMANTYMNKNMLIMRCIGNKHNAFFSYWKSNTNHCYTYISIDVKINVYSAGHTVWKYQVSTL